MRGVWRYLLLAVGALVPLATTTTVGYRVFAPAETLTPARDPYPALRRPSVGVAAELARAPLIVDGRLRVYAAKRQVWADTPVASRFETTPYWSLRRWPHEVVGVVAAPGPLVVSKWSDGALLAIDARTGAVAWRARSPVGLDHYTGGRTGAATVYEPPDLYTGRALAGRTVVVSSGAGAVAAFDSTSGALLWRADVPGSCAGTTFTGPGFLARLDSCANPAVLRRYDLATGSQLPDWRPPDAGAGWEITPLGCVTGRSECTAARTRRAGGVAEGWLLAREMVAAPALAAPDTWPVGDLAVGGPSGGPSAGPAGAGGGGEPGRSAGVTELTARSLRDGTPQWTWRPPEGSADRSPARIVAVERDAIYLVTERHTLVVLDPETGRELGRSPLYRVNRPTPPWTLGHVHARHRFVVVERLRDPIIPSAGERGHYLGVRPVLIAGI